VGLVEIRYFLPSPLLEVGVVHQEMSMAVLLALEGVALEMARVAQVIPHLHPHLRVLLAVPRLGITVVLVAGVEIQEQQARMHLSQTVVMAAQGMTEAEPVG
jgi:hypothetical protein